MRRLIFYIMMVAGIAVSTYFIVCGDAGFSAGFKLLEDMFRTVFDFSLFEAGFNPTTAAIYAVLVFVVFNGILLIILAFVLLLDFGAFSKVKNFYTIAIWYFISALIFTLLMGYSLFDKYSTADIAFTDWIFEQSWELYLPIVSSIVLLLFAVIFRQSEKKQ